MGGGSPDHLLGLTLLWGAEGFRIFEKKVGNKNALTIQARMIYLSQSPRIRDLEPKLSRYFSLILHLCAVRVCRLNPV